MFRNQETYAFLEPRQTLQFSEYWMPVRKSGNRRADLAAWRASPDVMEDWSRGSMQSSQSRASVSISSGSQQVSREEIDLTRSGHGLVPPARTPRPSTPLRSRMPRRIVLLRRTKRLRLDSPSLRSRLDAPAIASLGPDQRRFDDWIPAGEEDELNGRVFRALDIVGTLRRFPDSFLAQKARDGDRSRLRFDEAEDLEPCHGRTFRHRGFLLPGDCLRRPG